jgi:hypothetical protein
VILPVLTGLEVRCNFNLANSTVLSSLELGTRLPNAATATHLTAAPNITMRISDRRGGDISSAKVSSLTPTEYQNELENLQPEAGISKNYCATNSGSPEVELRFCPWLIMFKY